jgi:hypothetical protein
LTSLILTEVDNKAQEAARGLLPAPLRRPWSRGVRT